MRRLPNIVDGFSYDLGLRPVASDALTMALAALEPVRRAGTYRPRIYTVPDAAAAYPLPGYATVEEQVRIVPGSFLWGLSASWVATVFVWPSFWPHIRITEQGTGVELLSDFVSVAGLATGFGWPFVAGRITPLPEPRPIIEPGHLNVELANVAATTIDRFQLILYCAEPCTVIETGVVECRS